MKENLQKINFVHHLETDFQLISFSDTAESGYLCPVIEKVELICNISKLYLYCWSEEWISYWLPGTEFES